MVEVAFLLIPLGLRGGEFGGSRMEWMRLHYGCGVAAGSGMGGRGEGLGCWVGTNPGSRGWSYREDFPEAEPLGIECVWG